MLLTDWEVRCCNNGEYGKNYVFLNFQTYFFSRPQNQNEDSFNREMRSTYAAVMRNNLEWTNIVKRVHQNIWRIRWTLQWKLQNWQTLLEDSSSSSTSPQCRAPAGSGILSSSNWQQRDSISWNPTPGKPRQAKTLCLL